MLRNALGRGLGALIREPEAAGALLSQLRHSPSRYPHGRLLQSRQQESLQHGGPHQIDIDLIDPSPYQPRTRFREEALDELARSIQSSGIIQPLVRAACSASDFN